MTKSYRRKRKLKTNEEKEIIKDVKLYLMSMCTLYRERVYLMVEYDELLSITSPSLEEVKSNNKTLNMRMNNLIIKREILLKK